MKTLSKHLVGILLAAYGSAAYGSSPVTEISLTVEDGSLKLADCIESIEVLPLQLTSEMTDGPGNINKVFFIKDKICVSCEPHGRNYLLNSDGSVVCELGRRRINDVESSGSLTGNPAVDGYLWGFKMAVNEHTDEICVVDVDDIFAYSLDGRFRRLIPTLPNSRQTVFTANGYCSYTNGSVLIDSSGNTFIVQAEDSGAGAMNLTVFSDGSYRQYCSTMYERTTGETLRSFAPYGDSYLFYCNSNDTVFAISKKTSEVEPLFVIRPDRGHIHVNKIYTIGSNLYIGYSVSGLSGQESLFAQTSLINPSNGDSRSGFIIPIGLFGETDITELSQLKEGEYVHQAPAPIGEKDGKLVYILPKSGWRQLSAPGRKYLSKEDLERYDSAPENSLLLYLVSFKF